MNVLFSVRRSLSASYGLPLSTSRREFFIQYMMTAWRAFRCRLRMYDKLTCLSAKYPTDKGVTYFPFHGYTQHYDRLFAPMRERSITLLEIGLARKRDRTNPRVKCPSLELWAEYFPYATLLGLDIDDFSMIKQPRTKIYRGDQGNPYDLQEILHHHPTLDIVIDDGSHASYHQQLTLMTLWPALSQKGIYVIEDLDSQPQALEASLPPVSKTVDLLHDIGAVEALLGGRIDIQIYDSPLRGKHNTMACLRRQGRV